MKAPDLMTTPDDLEAKRRFIEAFFDDLEQKCAFLLELDRMGRQDEARALCCLYIDGLGNWLHPNSSKSARNFVETLLDYSDETTLMLVIPKHLSEHLPKNSAPKGSIASITAILAQLPTNEAFSLQKFKAKLAALQPDHRQWLESELWRGTIAAVVYERIRNPIVHQLGSAGGLLLMSITHEGASVDVVNLAMLHRALMRIIAFARQISENTSNWFGHSD